MIFAESPLAGACVIDMDRIADERGFFGRSFCVEEFRSHGLPTDVNQCSVSYNARRGTLRGMHFQVEPHDEAKLVRCTAGAIFDVIVDIRAESPTLHRWFGVELTARNRRSLFIPRGFAHGFVTLADESEVHYMISVPYVAAAGRGLRWDDPAIDIRWPIAPVVMSARDAAYPLLAQRGS
jgi:dTDP-4-dehydrorhamnose 3,5-epimerase